MGYSKHDWTKDATKRSYLVSLIYKALVREMLLCRKWSEKPLKSPFVPSLSLVLLNELLKLS